MYIPTKFRVNQNCVLYVYNDVYTISTPYNTHYEAVNIGLVNQITLMMYMLVHFNERSYLLDPHNLNVIFFGDLTTGV